VHEAFLYSKRKPKQNNKKKTQHKINENRRKLKAENKKKQNQTLKTIAKNLKKICHLRCVALRLFVWRFSDLFSL